MKTFQVMIFAFLIIAGVGGLNACHSIFHEVGIVDWTFLLIVCILGIIGGFVGLHSMGSGIPPRFTHPEDNTIVDLCIQRLEEVPGQDEKQYRFPSGIFNPQELVKELRKRNKAVVRDVLMRLRSKADLHFRGDILAMLETKNRFRL